MEVGCDKKIDILIIAKHISSVISEFLRGISEDTFALHIIYVL